jgi:hypothetical protein
VRVVAALLFAVIVALVAACGEGEDAPRAVEDPITTTTRSEVVPTDTTPITGAPSAVSATEIVVRGDLLGTVTDSAGNALGLVDAARGIQRVEIPGGTFLSGGEDDGGQYLLGADGSYEGAWTAEEDDEIVFIVHNRAGFETVQTAATLPFVLHAGDRLSLRIAVPADLASLELTVDGRDDRTVPFGEPVVGKGASDLIPPVSRITVEHAGGPNGTTLARVTITANDMGGAGIARVEYGITPSNESGVYAKPFEVPAAGRIAVRAIDRAGNIEAPYPEASLAPKG